MSSVVYITELQLWHITVRKIEYPPTLPKVFSPKPRFLLEREFRRVPRKNQPLTLPHWQRENISGGLPVFRLRFLMAFPIRVNSESRKGWVNNDFTSIKYSTYFLPCLLWWHCRRALHKKISDRVHTAQWATLPAQLSYLWRIVKKVFNWWR
jgi:hypothetical protein